MSTPRQRATKIEDNSPEAIQRRAQAEADARAIAEHQRREAEIEAMDPEERIAARLVERAGGEVYRHAVEFMAKSALDNGGVLKGPEVVHRAAKVLRNSRASLLRRLQEEESRRAGVVDSYTPTGRWSKPMTRDDIQSLVRLRYPQDTVNLGRWWQRRIVKAGIMVDEEHYRAVRIDLGQLLASLPQLTEADIAPHLAA